MSKITQKHGRAGGSTWCLTCLCGLWMAAGPAGAQQPRAGAAAAPLAKPALPAYKVVKLGAGCPIHQASINAKGQVAFSMNAGSGYRGFFYDGKSITDIGTLDGTDTLARAMNDWGQVVGGSGARAFLWSSMKGMLDLGVLPGGAYSHAAAINNLGHVTGSAHFNTPSLQTEHAFRWTPANGMEDLGSLTGRYSTGVSINDAGVIAGGADAPSGFLHGFAWTRGAGMMDIGTLGGDFSFPRVVGPEGQVAGDASTSGNAETHAFLWTSKGGMRDLGTAGGNGSQVAAMSRRNDNIAGIVFAGNNTRHAMAWSSSRGMTDLGTFGGQNSEAKAVNSAGQVVGFAETASGGRRAFVWAPGHGMLDLNQRLQSAPPGFELESAIAIADDGSIVAAGVGGGVVLLQPSKASGEAIAAHE